MEPLEDVRCEAHIFFVFSAWFPDIVDGVCVNVKWLIRKI